MSVAGWTCGLCMDLLVACVLWPATPMPTMRERGGVGRVVVTTSRAVGVVERVGESRAAVLAAPRCTVVECCCRWRCCGLDFVLQAASTPQQARVAARNLMATRASAVHRWHFRMLNDAGRNLAYRNAIRQLAKPGCVALDIGARRRHAPPSFAYGAEGGCRRPPTPTAAPIPTMDAQGLRTRAPPAPPHCSVTVCHAAQPRGTAPGTLPPPAPIPTPYTPSQGWALACCPCTCRTRGATCGAVS